MVLDCDALLTSNGKSDAHDGYMRVSWLAVEVAGPIE
jgi:hypothetical protein